MSYQQGQYGYQQPQQNVAYVNQQQQQQQNAAYVNQQVQQQPQQQLEVYSQDSYGNPLTFINRANNRVYALDANKNLVEINMQQQPIQQQRLVTQTNYNPQQQPHQNTQAHQMPSFNVQVPQQEPLGSGSIVSKNYTDRSKKEIINTNTQNIQQPQQEFVKEIIKTKSLVGYQPENGSELLPLYDVRKEQLDLFINDGNKTYSINIIPKQGGE